MPIYCGINGAKREIKELYCGVSGAKRNITEMWAGVDGAKKQIFSGGNIEIEVKGNGKVNSIAGEMNLAYILVNNKLYSGPAIIEAKKGDILTAVVDSVGSSNAKIYVNNLHVSSSTCELPINAPMTINLTAYLSSPWMPDGSYGIIRITT